MSRHARPVPAPRKTSWLSRHPRVAGRLQALDDAGWFETDRWAGPVFLTSCCLLLLGDGIGIWYQIH